jgi:DNA-binding MltR family transcriptional regulator
MNDGKINTVIDFMNKVTQHMRAKCQSPDAQLVWDVLDFRQTLTHESDRAAALMSAAYLDEQLKTLLNRMLVDDTKVKERVLGTSGAIDSFSSRIDLAYLLGLIPKNFRDDLELIRRIRNEFAHTAQKMDFETGVIKSRCFLLKSAYGTENMDAHQKFLRTSVVIATKLANFIIDNNAIEAMPDYDDSVSLEGLSQINAFVKEKFDIDMAELGIHETNAVDD